MDPVKNALDLAEIRHLCGLLLDHCTLLSCIRVCKTWRESFIGFLYTTIKVDYRAIHAPTAEQLQEHSHHIRHLELSNAPSSHLQLENLSGLKTLVFRTEKICANWTLIRKLVERSKHTSTKVELHLVYLNLDEDVWMDLSSLAKLDVLRLERCTITTTHFAELITVSFHLSELHLIHTGLPWAALDVKELGEKWARLQILDIHTPFDDPGDNHDNALLTFISHCPNLSTLAWLTGQKSTRRRKTELSKATAAKLVLEFENERWSHLRTLVIDDYLNFTDDEFAILLRSVTGIQSLGLEDALLGCDSADVLQRRDFLVSLTVLDLCHADISSRLVLKILSTAPALQHFMAPSIDAEHIAGSEPWICKELKTLVVGVRTEDYSDRNSDTWRGLSLCDRSDIQAAMMRWSGALMEALSSLQKLEVLDLRLHAWFKHEALQLDLTTRWDGGLVKLATLKRLRRLLFCAAQDVLEEDLQWMIQQWPKLACVHGPLTREWKSNQKLQGIFSQHDVCVGLECHDRKLNINDRGSRNCGPKGLTIREAVGDYASAVRAFNGISYE